LTYQAVFQTKISSAWDWAHLISTLALIAALFAVVALSVYAYQPVKLNNNFPDDYSYLYGADRPFAPSLARTNTNGAFDALLRRLPRSHLALFRHQKYFPSSRTTKSATIFRPGRWTSFNPGWN